MHHFAGCERGLGDISVSPVGFPQYTFHMRGGEEEARPGRRFPLRQIRLSHALP